MCPLHLRPPAPAEADEADPLSTLHMKMIGAAVEDHELPQLQNGEVHKRSLARRRLLARWQNGGVRGEKQQLAEVLSPLAGSDKVAVLHSMHRRLASPPARSSYRRYLPTCRAARWFKRS